MVENTVSKVWKSCCWGIRKQETLLIPTTDFPPFFFLLFIYWTPTMLQAVGKSKRYDVMKAILVNCEIQEDIRCHWGINFSRRVIRAKWQAMMLDELALSLPGWTSIDNICTDRCRAISVEADTQSLDSKNVRAQGNHLKTTGLEESIHAFLSAIDVLAP